MAWWQVRSILDRSPRLATAALLCALSPLAATPQGRSRTPAPAPPTTAPRPTTTTPATKQPPHAVAAPQVTPALSPAEPIEAIDLASANSVVSGVIEDSVGNPIVGADIYIPNLPQRTRSGAGGTYRLPGLPGGPVMIVARRIGYIPTTVTVHLRPGKSHDLDLTLSEIQARGFELPIVTVVAGPGTIRSVFQAGFFLRRATYPGGTFFDRDYIVAMNPLYLSDVFRTTTGMQQVRDRRGNSQWITRVNSTTNCPVRFFIDGISVPLNGMSIDELVRPIEVEGIEIYRGVATVPAEFSGKSVQDDSRCGVVAIWTRVTR